MRCVWRVRRVWRVWRVWRVFLRGGQEMRAFTGSGLAFFVGCLWRAGMRGAHVAWFDSHDVAISLRPCLNLRSGQIKRLSKTPVHS